MFSIRRALSLCLLVLTLVGLPLAAADRVFVLPRAGSGLVTVLNAADLGVEASIPANSSAFKVLLTPTADKYLILTGQAAEAVIVVDGSTLQVLRRLSLDSGISDGDLSPDGKNLLLAAGKLRVVRLGAEEEIIAEVELGGAARQVVVNSVLHQAFVLADAGRKIVVVDLETFEVTNTLSVPFVRAIALTSSEDRLLAITEDNMLQFRTSDQVEIPAIPAKYEIRAGAELIVVDSERAIVRNNGSAPNNTSQVFDLVARTAKGIGTPGTTGLQEVLVLGPGRAYAVVQSTQELAEVNLDATPNASVTPLDLGISARTLRASPNLSRVYVSSSVDNTVSIVDPATNQVITTTQTAIHLDDHEVIFGPSLKPPAAMTVNSGNNQFLPPGATTPNALSVTVTDEDGTPLFGVPVLFNSSENFGLQFQPGEIVSTNIRGVAAVIVTIPPDAAPLVAASLETVDTAAAVSAAGSDIPALEQFPPQPSLDEESIVPVTITATAGGPSTHFVLSIVRAEGIVIVSGDYQITAPRAAFPLPFVVLATDREGKPLAPGTEVRFSAATATCNPNLVPVDLNGFASVTCEANDLPPGIGVSQDGTITVQQADDPILPGAVFTIATTTGAHGLALEKVAGDGQTAPTGTALPIPLTLKLKAFDTIGSYGVGIQVRQKSGPPVLISPTFRQLLPNFPLEINVTLGTRAGTAVIEAVANAMGTPKVEFTVNATGGIIVRLEKEGDGQAARIGRFLANPLRVRAINESDQVVSHPDAEWSVVSGQASLLTANDSGGATARVQLGLTPGPVVIQARIDNVVATFNVSATPPQTTAVTPIDGSGQTVQVGTISEPLIVEVREIGDLPAFGAIVTYSAASNVLFHALDEDIEPANPLQLVADVNGRASAKAELLGILPIQCGAPGQTADASSIVVSSGASFATSFSIDPLGRTPVFLASGVSNGATFIGGLVPGSIGTVFGEGLSEGVTGTVAAGGPLTFCGVSLKVGGLDAPLLTVTRGEIEQINFQVPFGVAPGQATTVQLENNGSNLTVSGVPVFSAQPGIFEVEGVSTGTIGAVVHPADFALVTPERPAAKGAAVAAFFTGGGLLTPTVATGAPGPNPPALMALPVSVKVDGKEATFSFQGYAPGLLGVYQINFAIPETAACGVRSLTLSVGGADSLASTTAVACQ